MILLKWPTTFPDWYSPILHFFVMLALHCPNLWKKQVSMVHERICSLKCMLALVHGCNYIFIDTVSGFLSVGDGFKVFISFFCIYSGKVYRCIHFYVLPLNDPIKTILSSFELISWYLNCSMISFSQTIVLCNVYSLFCSWNWELANLLCKSMHRS